MVPVKRHGPNVQVQEERQPPPLQTPPTQTGFSSAVNDFLAHVRGAAVSNTTVLDQAAADNGALRLAAGTTFLSGDAALREYLSLTLQDDPNLIFPTATWGEIVTSDVRLVLPATPASLSFGWAVGNYGNCSRLCGGGQQTRRVVCMDSPFKRL